MKIGGNLHTVVSKLDDSIGVNQIISYQQAICDDANLPEQSDWCNNMLIHTYDFVPVLPVNVSRPYFRQGHRAYAKHLVSGDETSIDYDSRMQLAMAQAFKLAKSMTVSHYPGNI